MSEIDQQYLKNDQYKDASRLSARARLHSRYNRNPYGWFQWMFDLYRFPENARILELGAGAGWLWLSNARRIPSGWEITLSDFSAGMLAEQRKALAVIPHRFEFREIDAQAIPYPDATFDGLIANHMLYHVPDRPKAIAEMRRVLKPSGTLYTATNGERHLQEIHQIMRRFGFQPEEWLGGFVERHGYTLENAADQLRAQFPQVEVVRYDDAIELDDPQPLVDYILSYPIKLSDERIAELRTFVQAEIAKTGKLAITKDMGVAIARS
ncbi:MAG TPA: class I SAM-dependent methyltransferase [Phototrophicaceae bacterium]|nr:class I SAM-dependent methyltransferase [Phototrophicaceae bacterium]